jgi:long-subunit fatty acid transport protein
MTDDRHPEPRPGAILLCAGTEPAAAAALAEASAPLLGRAAGGILRHADRPLLVVSPKRD